ncbi:MAG: YigZ family protein [Flammeovirgaceae bacterium]|nr:YigZ family protein [Flammeovirgaceae bacterium]
MPVYSFKTIEQSAEGIYKEKGSKFLAFAFHVNTEDEIKNHLAVLRKKYFDARHHCYAWMVGAEKNHFRANDDGEPNHSAGDPILGQIRSHDLTNVLIVVVRYFGGVKLGVGGLIQAYKAAAEDALNHAVILVKEVMRKLNLMYAYESTPEVMRLVKDFELEIIDQKFEANCLLTAVIKERRREKFAEKYHLLQALGNSVQVQWIE